MGEVRVRILPNGDVQFIDKPELAALKAAGPATARRASHVEPVGRFARWAFRLLRWAFGESGRVAAWTRTWPVAWRVDLRPSGGPVIARPFAVREAAIAFEVRWLQESGNGANPVTVTCAACKYEGPPGDFKSNLDCPQCPDCGCPYTWTRHGKEA